MLVVTLPSVYHQYMRLSDKSKVGVAWPRVILHGLSCCKIQFMHAMLSPRQTDAMGVAAPRQLSRNDQTHPWVAPSGHIGRCSSASVRDAFM